VVEIVAKDYLKCGGMQGKQNVWVEYGMENGDLKRRG
jgi:hypothetical protein